MKVFLKPLALAAWLGMASATWSQPTPAQIQQQQFQQQQNTLNAVRADNIRRCGDEYGHGCRRQQKAQAEAQRQWEARERQIQKEIAELRRTPFYSAIAYDFVNKRVLGGGGYYSEKRAVEKALERCKSSNCQVVTTFANTCAMIAWPDTGIKTANDWFVGFDNDPQQAIVKSVRACEAKHGYNKCSYSDMKTKTGNALCSGYDYSIYGQK